MASTFRRWASSPTRNKALDARILVEDRLELLRGRERRRERAAFGQPQVDQQLDAFLQRDYGAGAFAAFAAQAKSLPQIKNQEALFLKTFQSTFDYFDTKNTVGKPFGWQSPDDWKVAAEILEKYMEAKPGTAPATYYTNDFLPKQ